MSEQRNDTAWQQGFVLNKAGAIKLGLIPDNNDDAFVIMISHDCDLVESNSVEPNCEVILGRKISSIDGLYTNGKNPRRLHLSFSGGSQQLSIELRATDKRLVKKDDILDELPIDELRLTRDEQFSLQSWLAARYHRPVFPDEFDRRLKAKPSEAHKKIANVIKGTGDDLIAVLFDIDSGRKQEHQSENDPYSLSIFLVFDVSKDPERAKAAANKAASAIKSLFRTYYFANGKWKNIELRNCLPISADALSLYQFRSTDPWHFDYLEIIATAS